MKIVRISEAKNNLSRLLHYVRRGGRVRILDRDTPVADLVSVEPSMAGDDEEALLQSLARRGLIRLGKGGPLPRELLTPGPGGPEAGVLDELLEQRRTGR